MARLHGPSVDYRGHNSPWLRHQLGSILHPIEEVSTCHQVGAQAEWVELAVNAVTPPGSRDDSKSTMDPRHSQLPDTCLSLPSIISLDHHRDIIAQFIANVEFEVQLQARVLTRFGLAGLFSSGCR